MSLLTGIYNKTQLHIDKYCKNIHQDKVICCACNNILIAKKGNINMHHYAHDKNTDCIIKRDNDCKTPWHILWQNIAKPEFLEKYMNNDGEIHIADVINEKNMVIEIQHSNLSQEEIEKREKFYDNMIWILDGTDIVKIDDKKDEEYVCVKYTTMFTTTNNYKVVKITKKFWSKITKKAYIDTGCGMLEIIKHIGNNFCICKYIEYIDFLNKYYKKILITSIENTNNLLIDHQLKIYENEKSYTIKKIPGGAFHDFVFDKKKGDILYCENTNSFYGKGTYGMRVCFFKLGYKFNKDTKKLEYDIKDLREENNKKDIRISALEPIELSELKKACNKMKKEYV
jgi:hypothetical protein